MKEMILKLFLFASILIFSGCSVDGTIKDENGNPIEQVQVTAIYNGGEQKTQTDANGQYNIGDLEKSGTVSVTVTKDGFIPQTQSAELGSSGISLNFILIKNGTMPITSKVNGTISDLSGLPLENIKVYTSIDETYTNSRGSYSLNAPVSAKVSVTTQSNAYAQNSHTAVISENVSTLLDMTITPIDKTINFDVNDGAILSSKGASVEFGLSSIVNLDGSTYTGSVKANISYNQVTNDTGKKVFPGAYLGLDSNGNEQLLVSYGFMDVTLVDTNGIQLRLADGATATLTFPRDSNIITAPSASVALWYYDTVDGIWVQDGYALYDTNANTYTATVTHFTTWGLNFPTGAAVLNGCVEDTQGNPISPVNILVETPGYYGYEKNQDVNGNFTIKSIPANQSVSLVATTSELSSKEIVLTFGNTEIKTLSDCLVLESLALKEHSITGKLVASDGTPLGNQVLNLQVDGYTIEPISVDANGNFSSKPFILKNPNSVLTLMDNLRIGEEFTFFEQVIIIDQNNDVTNLGNIEVKTTTIVGCAQTYFGSTIFDYAIIAKDSTSGTEYAGIDSNDGTFSFIIPQNSQYYNFYAYSFGGGSSANFNFTANTDIIYFNNPCLTLQ